MSKINSSVGSRIVSVFIEDLFGLHTYDIKPSGIATGNAPTLLILYGDNGTGKTTVLRLIYHLLGKEDNRGHRTYLARVPFRRLRVTLTPATTVEAYRKGKSLDGSYLKLPQFRPDTPVADSK